MFQQRKGTVNSVDEVSAGIWTFQIVWNTKKSLFHDSFYSWYFWMFNIHTRSCDSGSHINKIKCYVLVCFFGFFDSRSQKTHFVRFIAVDVSVTLNWPKIVHFHPFMHFVRCVCDIDEGRKANDPFLGNLKDVAVLFQYQIKFKISHCSLYDNKTDWISRKLLIPSYNSFTKSRSEIIIAR